MNDGIAMFREDLWTRLEELDTDLQISRGRSHRFEMTLVGSGPLLLLGILSPERSTTDIDVLEASREVAEFLDRYQMNLDVSTFFYEFPDGWTERKRRLDFEGAILDVFMLSLEDLTISKIRAFRQQDQNDLRDIVASGELNWELLEKIVSDPLEVEAGMEPGQWEVFLENYRKVKGMRADV